METFSSSMGCGPGPVTRSAGAPAPGPVSQQRRPSKGYVGSGTRPRSSPSNQAAQSTSLPACQARATPSQGPSVTPRATPRTSSLAPRTGMRARVARSSGPSSVSASRSRSAPVTQAAARAASPSPCTATGVRPRSSHSLPSAYCRANACPRSPSRSAPAASAASWYPAKAGSVAAHRPARLAASGTSSAKTKETSPVPGRSGTGVVRSARARATRSEPVTASRYSWARRPTASV